MGALKIIGIVLLVLVVITGGIAAYFFIPEKTAAATLYIKKGTVDVKRDSAWFSAENSMELKISDSVRTLADSAASIIFYDNSVIRLESESEVKIQELASSKEAITVSIKQDVGRIWAKALKLSGIGTDFSVETPTTVATIRGTAFGSVVEDDATDIIVADGIVGVKSYKIEEGVKEFIAEEDVNANEQASVAEGRLDEIIEKIPIKEEYKEWAAENKEKDIEFLNELKIRVIYKYENLVELAKSRLNLTDEQVKEYIIEYRSQEEYKKEIDKYVEKYPIIPTKLVTKIEDINREINKLESSDQE